MLFRVVFLLVKHSLGLSSNHMLQLYAIWLGSSSLPRRGFATGHVHECGMLRVQHRCVAISR